jgi:hypothetical protein
MLKSCHAKNTSLPQQISCLEKIIVTQKDILVTDINCQGNVFCTIIEFFQAHDEWVLLLLLISPS